MARADEPNTTDLQLKKMAWINVGFLAFTACVMILILYFIYGMWSAQVVDQQYSANRRVVLQGEAAEARGIAVRAHRRINNIEEWSNRAEARLDVLEGHAAPVPAHAPANTDEYDYMNDTEVNP